MVKIDVHSFGFGDILAGSMLGQRVAARILEALSAEGAGILVAIDFVKIRVATASFLRTALFGVRDHLRRRSSEIVIVNMSPAVVEELTDVLNSNDEALLVAELKGKRITNVKICGRMDPACAKVITLAMEQGEVTARQLAELHPDDNVQMTAWNNRLAALSRQGLLAERIEGRRKFYRLATEM